MKENIRMESHNLETLRSFDLSCLPDLDTAVLGALELFEREQLPNLDISAYQRPLVVGSGNAEATGRIIFENTDALFASESTFEGKLEKVRDIDGVVLISSSGGKHAPLIAKRAQEYGKHVTLITNTPESAASQYLDSKHPYDVYVLPKNREPYTYNVSAYLGMILAQTKEDPANIRKFISREIEALEFPDFSLYDKFYLIVPPAFSGIIRMLEIKFIELFGRRIARDIETSEYIKHATTVVPSDELFISFGYENTLWGKPEHRFNLPLPPDSSYGAMMAIGYYIIGRIQKEHHPYFKEHLEEYTAAVSAIFGEEISPIVE